VGDLFAALGQTLRLLGHSQRIHLKRVVLLLCSGDLVSERREGTLVFFDCTFGGADVGLGRGLSLAVTLESAFELLDLTLARENAVQLGVRRMKADAVPRVDVPFRVTSIAPKGNCPRKASPAAPSSNTYTW
jgi:hypothetical protein